MKARLPPQPPERASADRPTANWCRRTMRRVVGRERAVVNEARTGDAGSPAAAAVPDHPDRIVGVRSTVHKLRGQVQQRPGGPPSTVVAR